MSTCAICGARDALRLGLCPACGPSPVASDAVLFVDAPVAGRGEARDSLDALFGDALGSALRRVAAGRRPLLRLPAPLAARAATRLAGNGVPAVAVPAAAAWTRMPAHFFAMLALVILTGTLAGVRAVPSILWATPLFAALLGVAAQEGMRRPVLAARRRARGLGRAARVDAASVLADLEEASPRRRLADLVGLADRLTATDTRVADIDALVTSAAATARDVDVLAAARAAVPAGERETVERCGRLYDEGIALLDRALTALGRVAAVSGPEAEVARARLGEIAREMEREAAARTAAARSLADVRPDG